MKAIADCSNAIKGLYKTNPSTELRDLQQLLDNTTPTITDTSNPVNIPAVPRVATEAPTEEVTIVISFLIYLLSELCAIDVVASNGG